MWPRRARFRPQWRREHKVPIKDWRRSKLEKPRSAEISCQFCATVLPTPPKVDESSIDLPVLIEGVEGNAAAKALNRAQGSAH